MRGPFLLPEGAATETRTDVAVQLLSDLIAIPSFSREEDRTADLLSTFMSAFGLDVRRIKNNVWACNKHYKHGLPTILLNSHHDTVKPNSGYIRNPFEAKLEEGKLYGLGSNDAGAALVSLLMSFVHFSEQEQMPYNLVFAATAEEEISGRNGVELLLPEIGPVDFAIVGEPTGMHLAIAEKGLMVLDCRVLGKAAHAAHGQGDNAIYKAMKDIEWFRTFVFPQRSALLGNVKMSVTEIRAGKQHNVIPDLCEFTVDVRSTDAVGNAEALAEIRRQVSCEVTPRSLRLNASSIAANHPVVAAAVALGRQIFGSPTISDQALMNFPSVKIGPGDSQRSHCSDEFIFISEIAEGIKIYDQLLSKLLLDA